MSVIITDKIDTNVNVNDINTRTIKYCLNSTVNFFVYIVRDSRIICRIIFFT